MGVLLGHVHYKPQYIAQSQGALSTLISQGHGYCNKIES